MANDQHTFYEAVQTGIGHQWQGRLYKWDETGNKEITIFKTEVYNTEHEAIDSIIAWAEDNGFDPTLG